MAASGHMSAHTAQPVQPFLASCTAKQYPLALSFVESTMPFLGQKAMQNWQPLHNSVLTTIFPFIHPTEEFKIDKV
jgi:hypothetical protein